MNKKEQKTVIELSHVTKSYVLHHEKPTFIEQIMKRGKTELFTALDDVSLRIYKGQKVGIIGVNGAGKTTLLKIISGITTPTNGTVKTKGRVISLIELDAGFHPELTGEENIFLNGLIIGMSRCEIEEKFKQIVSFADISEFIDTPLYTYSSGMKLRLGFSIAVHANPDILILDEGIIVGDLDFQQKSSNKINEFFKQKKTILIVSHWLEYLQKEVDRIIYIADHKIKMDGEAESVLSFYRSREQ